MIELINDVIDSKLSHLYTMNPATIIRYYPDDQTADVRLVVTRPFTDTTGVNPVMLYNVPIIMPQGSNWVIGGSMGVGDAVLVFHSMFDVENWMAGEKDKVYPASGRDTHVLDSAFAIAGAFTYNSPTHDKRFTNDLHFVKGANYIVMGDSGVKISSGTGTATITLDNSGNIDITSSGSTHIKSSETTIDNNVNINGKLNVSGGIFSPTYSGFGGAGGTMTIQSATISGDAVIGGISYKGHIHKDAENRPTTTPQ